MSDLELTGLRPADAVERAVPLLAAAGVADPGGDARSLVGVVRGSGEEEPLTRADAARLATLLERRLDHEPLAYILGSMEFMGTSFAVDRRAQVTRPKMEAVVRAAVDAAAELSRHAGRPIRAVDVGTGCGALGIMLARLHDGVDPVYAADLSREALEIAAVNAERHGVAGRLRLLEGNLLEPLPEPVELVVANLPFVRPGMPLQPGVREYEPSLAVFGEGEHGWGAQVALVEQLAAHVERPAVAIVTLHDSQEPLARRVIAEALPSARQTFAPVDLGWSKLVRIDL